MLNAFPYTSGHLMVLPMRAVEQLTELDDTEHAELWHGVRLATQAIEAAYSPQGINVGATSAGSGRRDSRPPARARPAPLGWRHQLHDGDREHSRDA